MSGHSKWSTIKRAKGAADAKRGALFTKLARNISLAVKEGGGGDPDMNFRLRIAVDQARSNNMPQDSITRAIRRATGEGGEAMEDLAEVTYEGYGPSGGAILVKGPHHQPQPHRVGGTIRVQQGRRQSGRSGLRRLELRQPRADHPGDRR